MKEKLKYVRDNSYITSCDKVRSFTHFLSIPKTYLEVNGKKVDDIWMVYDATRSELNEAVWFLWFPMSTTTSYLQSVEVGNFRKIVISGRCS